MMRVMPTTDDLMAPSEVAALFDVHPETVRRWARTGRLNGIRLPSGRTKYRRSEIDALLESESVRASA